MVAPELTAVLAYRLTGSAADFVEASGQLVRRVQAEGHEGVRGYRFFVDPAAARAHAVVDYRDAGAWIGHHEIISDWPEFAGLRRVALLTEISFLGKVSDAMLDWLAASGLTATVRHGSRLAAGFVRG